MVLVETSKIAEQIRIWAGGSTITIGYREQPDGAGGIQAKWRVTIDGATTIHDTLLGAMHQMWVAAGMP